MSTSTRPPIDFATLDAALEWAIPRHTIRLDLPPRRDIDRYSASLGGYLMLLIDTELGPSEGAHLPHYETAGQLLTASLHTDTFSHVDAYEHCQALARCVRQFAGFYRIRETTLAGREASA
ncbi:hypothetical protein [Streptomyces sp. NPDC057302]|uniref:hypothetical protein n=1 Tax=Streptomyces sp. NPDC057302 TaxID=3346094 RepID=UPI00362DC47F